MAEELAGSEGFDRAAKPEERKVTEDLLAELVKLRKRRKIGQEPVARALGLTQSQVSQIETMKRNPSFESIIIYAHAIGAKITITPERQSKKDDSK